MARRATSRPSPAATGTDKPKDEPSAPAKKAEPAAASAPAKAAAAATTEPAAGGDDPEKNCGAAYDMAKQMMEAMTKKFGKGKATKPMPPRDKYVAACKQLPAPVTRCMNPKVMMAEQAKCKEVMTKHSAEIAKIKAMMK